MRKNCKEVITYQSDIPHEKIPPPEIQYNDGKVHPLRQTQIAIPDNTK